MNADGRSAVAYRHAGLSPDDRTYARDAFLSGEVDIIVATNAFGMGIDKPDVRFVVHTAFAASPDAYCQEAGRAGRDGLPADALPLHPVRPGTQEVADRPDLPDVNALQAVHGRDAGRRADEPRTGRRELRQQRTSLQVGLQVLAQARLESRSVNALGGDQAVSAAVERFERSHITALETALAGQRSRRMAQIEEMIAYAEKTRGIAETALLSYFGDPAAEPGGDRPVATCAVPMPGLPVRLPSSAARPQAAPAEENLSEDARRSSMRWSSTGQCPAAAWCEHGVQEDRRAGSKLVTEGHLDIDDVIPAEVQESLAEACEAMERAGSDYLSPRPGYLQTAMRYCLGGHQLGSPARMYFAHLRRQAAVDDLGYVDMDESGRSRKTNAAGGARLIDAANPASDTVTESLEMFKAGKSVEEIADERDHKPITVEAIW
ncbi:MAG: helicase-related protein [Thermomicrobiales bacterium]